MEFRKASFGSYLLFKPSEWDCCATSALAGVARSVAWADRNGFKVNVVAFMIEGLLKVSVAVFPDRQSEPTEEQIQRLHKSCSEKSYPGIDSLEVLVSRKAPA